MAQRHSGQSKSACSFSGPCLRQFLTRSARIVPVVPAN